MKRVLNIVLLLVVSIVLSSCDALPADILETVNNGPVISGDTDVTYPINSEEPDWTDLIQAIDDSDGAIKITEDMIDSNVDFTTAGSYKVEIFITDSDGTSSMFTINVEIVDDRVVTFSLIGGSDVTLEVHTDFTDLGALSLNLDASAGTYSVEGSVDTDVVGVYTLTYTMEGVDTPLVKTVNVVDTTPPVITLDTVNLVYGEYTDQSWLDYIDNVTDNYSENITVEVSESTVDYNATGTYDVTIKATDEAGNETTASFSVVLLDITLLITGDSIIDIEVNSDYTDLGAVALDSESVSHTVLNMSDLDTSVLGTYTVTYTVDGFTNLSVSRTIKVIDTTAPILVISDKTINKGDTDIDWTSEYETLTDNYDTEVVVVEVENNIVYGIAGIYTVTLLATDSSSNETSVTFTVSIPDTMIPILNELPSEEIVIDFWHIYGQSRAALLDSMIDEFELLYPNITVNSMSQGSYSDLLSKTKKSIIAGTNPDLIVGYPDHTSEYLEFDGLIPLNDFIESDIWGLDLSDFIDSYVDENSQTGYEMYSMPYSKSSEVLIYNKTLFDSNGYTFTDNQVLTWEELEVMAETIVGNGDNQCSFMINFDSSANLYTNTSRQWDAGYTNAAGELLVDNANTRSMLETLKGYMSSNILALPIEWDQVYGSANFLAQDVCMTVGSTAGVKYNNPANSLNPDDQFEIGVLPVPQFEGKTQSAVQQGPNIAILKNTTDAERLASWLLISHLTNAENTAAWAIDTGYLPVSQSGYDSAMYQSFLNNPSADYAIESAAANAAYAQVSYNHFEYAFSKVGMVTSATIRNGVGDALESLYLGSSTVEEVIDNLVEDFDNGWNSIFYSNSTEVYMKYNGELFEVLELLEPFTPMTALVYIDGERYEMTTTDTVDTSVVDDYTVVYQYIDDSNEIHSITQIIHVISTVVDINVFNSLEIEAGNTALLQGIVVGTVINSGFHLYDGTGTVYVYQGQTSPYAIGDKVMISGEKTLYFGLVELTNTTSAELISSGNELPEFHATTIENIYAYDNSDSTIFGQAIHFNGFITTQGSHNNVYSSWYTDNLDLLQFEVYYKSGSQEKVTELGTLVGKQVNMDALLFSYFQATPAHYRVTVNTTGEMSETELLTDLEKANLTLAFTHLDVASTAGLLENIVLPTLSIYTNETITWTSSDVSVISIDGVVNTLVDTDQTVTVTATVTVGNETVTLDYIYTVISQ